ncbi:DgyrCDS13026 [Dimorphilus gyrociliatus]|uniref:DgyrCDS13026 n=1 Tax=Dimorphilus gyrociliatus TaxID=2664684 RepID=A0A7I8W9F1_9ANNE|nr:DgyrCDS13026 [Dimorphilus gyrociliatus]
MLQVYEQLTSDYKEFISEIDGVLHDESFISEESPKDRIFGVFDPIYRKCERLLEEGELLLDRGHQLHLRYKNASFLKKKFSKENKKIVDSLVQMTGELRSKLTKLRSIYIAKNDALINTIETTGLEEGFRSVIQWIKGPGDKLLVSQTEIGEDYTTADKLRKVHEELELKCADTYSNYAELRHKVTLLLESGKGEKADLINQCDYMESVCRNFANILEKRRILVITSVRFHRFFEELSRSLDDLLRTLHNETAFEDVQSAETALSDLEGKVEEILHLYDEAIEEGHELLNLLSLSVKNWVGQDVTPDRTKQIEHVENLLDALQQRRTRSDELAGARKKKLQQLLELRTCEQNAIQAIQWIAELCDTVNERNAATPKPGERLTDYHNTQLQVHKTALETYNYGKELLQRALVLRRVLHQDLEANHEMMQDLNDTWKRFTRGELEHVQRLKNASLFHHNVEQFESDMNDIYQEMKMVENYQLKPADAVWQNWHKKERIYQQGPEIIDIGKKLLEKLQEPVIREYGENREIEFMDETVVNNLRQKLSKFEDNLKNFTSDWENMFSAYKLDQNENLVDGDGNILRYAYQRKQEDFTPTHTSTLMRPPDSSLYSTRDETLSSVPMREKSDNQSIEKLENQSREQSTNLERNTSFSKYEDEKFFAERNKILNKYGRPYKPFSSFLAKKEDWYHEGTDRTLERPNQRNDNQSPYDGWRSDRANDNQHPEGQNKWRDEESIQGRFYYPQKADVSIDTEQKYAEISEQPNSQAQLHQMPAKASYFFPSDPSNLNKEPTSRNRPQSMPLAVERIPVNNTYDQTDRGNITREDRNRYSDPNYASYFQRGHPRDSDPYASHMHRNMERSIHPHPQEQFNRTSETPVQDLNQKDQILEVDPEPPFHGKSKPQDQKPYDGPGYWDSDRQKFADPRYSSQPNRQHNQPPNTSRDPTQPLFIDTSFPNGIAQSGKPLNKYDPEYERLASDYRMEERQPRNSGTYPGPWYHSSPRVIPFQQPTAPFYTGAQETDESKYDVGERDGRFSEQFDHRRTAILDHNIATTETLPEMMPTAKDEYSDRDDSVFVEDDHPKYATGEALKYVLEEDFLEDPTELVVFPHCGTRTHFPLSGLHPDQPKNTFPIINDDRRYVMNGHDTELDEENYKTGRPDYHSGNQDVSKENYSPEERGHYRNYHEGIDFATPVSAQQDDRINALPEQQKPTESIQPEGQRIFKSGKLIRLIGSEKPQDNRLQDELSQEITQADSLPSQHLSTFRNEPLHAAPGKSHDDSLLSDSLENEYAYNRKYADVGEPLTHPPHARQNLALDQNSAFADLVIGKNQENTTSKFLENYPQFKEYPPPPEPQVSRYIGGESYAAPEENYEPARVGERPLEKLPIFGLTGAKALQQSKDAGNDEEFRVIDQNDPLQRDDRYPAEDFRERRRRNIISKDKQISDSRSWETWREPQKIDEQDVGYGRFSEEPRQDEDNFRDYRMYSTEIPRSSQRQSDLQIWPTEPIEYSKLNDKYLDQSITEIIDPNSTDDRGIHDETTSHLSRTSSVVLENRLEKVTELFAKSQDPNKSLERLNSFLQRDTRPDMDDAFIDPENQEFWNDLNRKLRENNDFSSELIAVCIVEYDVAFRDT